MSYYHDRARRIVKDESPYRSPTLNRDEHMAARDFAEEMLRYFDIIQQTTELDKR